MSKYSYTTTYPIQSLRDITYPLSIFFDQHGLGFNIADQLVFIDIGELGQKARDGKITIEDLQGGTFTISNGGVYGSMLSTPILNPPQSGVLGMHNIIERPIAINNEIKIKSMMYLALSYDHRIIDGKDSVSFLKLVKENLEDPRRLFLDL